MRRRNGMDDHRVAAEWLELEPQSRECVPIRLERFGVTGREMNGLGKEQPLRVSPTRRHLLHEPLVQHAFVRRVLVDEDHALGMFVQQIRSSQLEKWWDGDRVVIVWETSRGLGSASAEPLRSGSCLAGCSASIACSVMTCLTPSK